MPKTIDKRAAAKRATKVRQAHSTQLDAPVVRRRPPSRRGPVRESSNIFARYPVGFTLLFLVIVAVTGFTLYARQIGPFAPKPVAPRSYPSLPASAAKSPCQAVAKYVETTTPIPDSANIQHTYTSAPPMVIDQKKVYCVGITTTKGFLLLELDPTLAPNTVNNFVYLANHHFYDGLTFHRVERKGQVDSSGTKSTLNLIQGGDPSGNGSGGPGYTINDELNQTQKYIVGALAMANTGQPNSGGSQFFIDTNDDSGKDQLPTHSYTLFGNLVKGIDVANNINPGDKMLRVLVMAVDGPPSLPTPQATPTPTPGATPSATPTKTPSATPSVTATATK